MKELNQKEISNVAGMGQKGACYGAIVGAVAGTILPFVLLDNISSEGIPVGDRARFLWGSKFGFTAAKRAVEYFSMGSAMASLGVLVSMGVGYVIEEMLPKA